MYELGMLPTTALQHSCGQHVCASFAVYINPPFGIVSQQAVLPIKVILSKEAECQQWIDRVKCRFPSGSDGKGGVAI